MIGTDNLAYIAGLFDGEGSLHIKRSPEKKKTHKERVLEAIKKLPKGKLEGVLAHDPMAPWIPDGITVKLTMDIDPDEGTVTVDLRENIDCIEAGLNLTESTSTMAAAQGVLCSLGEDLPSNSGSIRPIKVLLRENRVLEH